MTIPTTLYCPTCGAWTEVVRQIHNNMVELACEPCETTHVVLLSDHEKIRVPDVPAEADR